MQGIMLNIHWNYADFISVNDGVFISKKLIFGHDDELVNEN